jgi:uncharacterized membrane protein
VPDVSFDLFDLTGWFIAVVLIAMIVMLVLFGIFAWTMFRGVLGRDDPAILELKDRLARGEIDVAEYQVRLRALRRGED